MIQAIFKFSTAENSYFIPSEHAWLSLARNVFWEIAIATSPESFSLLLHSKTTVSKSRISAEPSSTGT